MTDPDYQATKGPLQGACTVVAKNYFAHARTLAESLRATNPGLDLYVLLIDSFEGYFDPAAEPFKVIALETLAIPDLTALRFKYDITELATAVKPYFFNYLLGALGIDKLLYIDPDIVVTASFDPLLSRLETANYVLTPHLDTDYPDDGKLPTLQAQLVTGAFNLGFLGLRNTPTTLRMIAWLERKLHDFCIVETRDGYFVDQKFFDLAITLFPGGQIEHDPGYNMAPWNLHSRTLSKAAENDSWLCNGKPLYFYHFSNYKPTAPDRIALYVERYTVAQRPDIAPLYGWYRSRLYHHGYEACHRWPYEFNHFADGTPILKETRRYYYRRPALQTTPTNPFASERLGRLNVFFRWRKRVVDPVYHWLRRFRNGCKSLLHAAGF